MILIRFLGQFPPDNKGADWLWEVCKKCQLCGCALGTSHVVIDIQETESRTGNLDLCQSDDRYRVANHTCFSSLISPAPCRWRDGELAPVLEAGMSSSLQCRGGPTPQCGNGPFRAGRWSNLSRVNMAGLLSLLHWLLSWSVLMSPSGHCYGTV